MPFIRILRGFLVTALSLAGAVAAHAESPLESLEATMNGFYADGRFTGCVLAACDDHVVYQRAFGLADVEREIPNTVETPFRIASVTKGVTAVLVLQAAERDELSLDAPLSSFFAALEGAPAGKVTLRHLLSHRSGIPDFAPELHDGETVEAAVVRRLKGATLATEPGATREYCNVGYTILGLVLEKALGKPYATLAQERVFEPCGMTNTYVEVGPAREKTRARGYERIEGRLEPHEIDVDLELVEGAGSIVSTAADLHRFSLGLASDQLLSAESRQMMSDRKNRFGCGIMELPTMKLQFFQGGMTGAAALLVRINDGEQTLVLLSNRGETPLKPIALGLLPVIRQIQ